MITPITLWVTTHAIRLMPSLSINQMYQCTIIRTAVC